MGCHWMWEGPLMAQNRHLGVLLVSLNPSIRAVSRRGTTAEALLLLP